MVFEAIEASILSIMLWLPIVLLLLMRMRETSGETLLLPVEGRGTVDWGSAVLSDEHAETVN